ncbi:hypothetical protein EON62_02480 [archaeon]|nr:MAG: hypothetical protein EON62_02480 [archaeon]
MQADLVSMTDGVSTCLLEVEKYVTSCIAAGKSKSKIKFGRNVAQADAIRKQLAEMDTRLSHQLQTLTAAQGAKQLEQSVKLEKQIEQLQMLTQNMFAMSLLANGMQKVRSNMGVVMPPPGVDIEMGMVSSSSAGAGASSYTPPPVHPSVLPGSPGFADDDASDDSDTDLPSFRGAGGESVSGASSVTGPRRAKLMVRPGGSEASFAPLGDTTSPRPGAAASSKFAAGSGLSPLPSPNTSPGYASPAVLTPHTAHLVDEIAEATEAYAIARSAPDPRAMRAAHYLEMAAHQFICGSFTGALAAMAGDVSHRMAILVMMPWSPVVTMLLFAWWKGQGSMLKTAGLRNLARMCWTVYRLYAMPCIAGGLISALTQNLWETQPLVFYHHYLVTSLIGVALFLFFFWLLEE